jgi:hypothetical protein
MAEQQILNLDELIPETQYVQLGGAKYAVNPPTVDMYLRIMKARLRMKNADPDVEMTEQAIMMIKLACPDMPEEKLVALPLRALMALSDMVQGMMEDIAKEEGGESAEAGE